MQLRKLAIQIDPLDSLNFVSDSTIMLALAAQKFGFECYCYQPENLIYKSGKIYISASKVQFNNSANFYEIIETGIYESAEFDIFLMRQDPPFNLNYLTLTYLLDIVTQNSLVVNNPTGVRNISEKLSALYFPEFTPNTLITRNYSDVLEFLEIENKIVLKPLYGFGGLDVKLIEKNAPNAESTFNYYLEKYSEPIIVQEFLPDVIKNGDKRVIFLDGKVTSSIARLPKQGEIRANLAQGGSAEVTKLTKREQEICTKVGILLFEHDIMLAGIDLIAEHLIEINVTCPTGLRAVDRLYNINLADEFWKQLLQKHKLS